MTDPYAYGIDPPDEQYYRQVIQREKRLHQSGLTHALDQFGVQCVMILYPPRRFDPGQAVRVYRDVAFPYCYELSIDGYNGFGNLEAFRFRITENGRLGDEFTIPTNATMAQFVNSFPAEWRRKMKVTGGTFGLPDGGVVETGRYFVGFSELPDQFLVAQTNAPTEAEIIDLVGFDNEGNLLPAPEDPSGFTTTLDKRVIARLREVRFLCGDVPFEIETLVDTSVPSPISPGSLAYVAPATGMGYSIISCEPRVFQNIEGPFEDDPTKSPFVIYPTSDPFIEAES